MQHYYRADAVFDLRSDLTSDLNLETLKPRNFPILCSRPVPLEPHLLQLVEQSLVADL